MVIKAVAQATSELECSECGDDVYQCDSCQDYFEDEEDIYCDEEVGDHYCELCKENKKRRKK